MLPSTRGDPTDLLVACAHASLGLDCSERRAARTSLTLS